MVFSSILFIFYFLPAFLLAYYLTPARYRNFVGLLASLFFYAWGEPRLVLLLLVGSVVDFLLGKGIAHSDDARKRKRLVALSVLLNIGFLTYYKYAGFFVDQASTLLDLFGISFEREFTVLLPIGISFYTFQKLSYIVDVYRKTVPAAPSFVQFGLYVSLFPQLIAGPIVRYHDVAKQLVSRTYTLAKFSDGVWRFALGLGKKVLIANPMAAVADTLFAQPADALPLPFAWLGIICYAFQIYFDFSGYSDMAIGLGKMMGFEFLENFNRPYIAKSITEFWRRWHISLSNWMKEYLYIPLGGNRVSKGRMYFNLWVVFLISGFWHGASWNFIVWGALHGTFLCVEKYRGKLGQGLIAQFLTFVLVLIAWVFFRAETLPAALHYLNAMFIPSAAIFDVPMYSLMPHRTISVFILAAVICFFPEKTAKKVSALVWKGCPFSKPAIAVTLIVLSVCSLANSGYNPFIYFRF